MSTNLIYSNEETPLINPYIEPGDQSIQEDKGCWLGRVFIWIKEYVLDPIGRFFQMIFCCGKQQDNEHTDKTDDSTLNIEQPETATVDSISKTMQTENTQTAPESDIDRYEANIPVIDLKNPNKQRALNDFLVLIAKDEQFITWLEPSTDKTKTLSKAAKELQTKLYEVIKKIRSSSDHPLSLKELLEIQTSLKVISLNQGLNFALNKLADLFKISKSDKYEALKPFLWSEIEPFILERPETLSPVVNSAISRPLYNLSSTCYINATIQMIARVSAFDGMLMNPIVCEDPDLKYRIALQSHLAAIIHQMRLPDPKNATTPIPREQMETLFRLLQICGWKSSPSEQQDPQEFLAFLRGQLGMEGQLFQQAEVISYHLENNPKNSIKTDVHAEIQVSIPFNESPGKGNAKIHKTNISEGESLQKLIQNDLVAELKVEEGNGYCPHGRSVAVDAQKEIYFVGEAPSALFIQQKRFGYDVSSGRSFRIDGAIPFTPTIEIPFYDAADLQKDPVMHTYQLKAAICHSGGSSANSGHYTTICAQNYRQTDWTQAKEVWIHYNDFKVGQAAKTAPPVARYHESLQHKDGVINDLTTKSYYMTYERVT